LFHPLCCLFCCCCSCRTDYLLLCCQKIVIPFTQTSCVSDLCNKQEYKEYCVLTENQISSSSSSDYSPCFEVSTLQRVAWTLRPPIRGMSDSPVIGVHHHPPHLITTIRGDPHQPVRSPSQRRQQSNSKIREIDSMPCTSMMMRSPATPGPLWVHYFMPFVP
jgi:hypothetical protein